MQGRLSPQIRNKIQYFPWKTWKQEFFEARKLKLSKIEWTLDYYNLNKNPLLNKKGQSEINKLKKKFKIECNSVTTDCFMQRPFWKQKNNNKSLFFFEKLIYACNKFNRKRHSDTLFRYLCLQTRIIQYRVFVQIKMNPFVPS